MHIPRLFGKPLTLTGGNRRTALRILNRVLDWLESDDIDYALDTGTLLGAVRDRDLIPWDNGVDLCVPDRELKRLMAVLQKNRSLTLSIRRCYWDIDFPGIIGDEIRLIRICPRQGLVFHGRIGIHIYVKYLREDGFCYWQFHDRLCRMPREYMDELETIEFLGRSVRVPSNPESYLAYIYGDWRAPLKSGWQNGSIVYDQKTSVWPDLSK